MNGKQAKRLRRIAADATVGKPARGLVAAEQRAYDEKGHQRVTHCAVNEPASMRGVARKLKQLFRKGALK